MTCAHIPQLPYSEFSERLHRKMAEQRIPISGTLEITLGCNFHCAHCYVGHANNAAAIRNELSTEEIFNIIDQVVEAGCLWLLITGGDPLARRDFTRIWEYAKRKGLILTLFTNGSLLTPRLADFLAEYRPFRVEITLYGASEETYRRVTGMKGMHARARRGIDLLLERKLPLKLKSMLMTHNVDDLPAMRAFAEGLGLEYSFDGMMNNRLDGGDNPMQVRLPIDQLIQIEMSDPKRVEARREMYPQMLGRRSPNKNLYICGAGFNSFHINAYGELAMCELERAAVYDLRQGSFKQGWEEFIPALRARQHSDTYACAACDLRFMCFQCPAYSGLEFGHPEGRSAYLCEFSHRMAQLHQEKMKIS